MLNVLKCKAVTTVVPATADVGTDDGGDMPSIALLAWFATDAVIIFPLYTVVKE